MGSGASTQRLQGILRSQLRGSTGSTDNTQKHDESSSDDDDDYSNTGGLAGTGTTGRVTGRAQDNRAWRYG